MSYLPSVPSWWERLWGRDRQTRGSSGQPNDEEPPSLAKSALRRRAREARRREWEALPQHVKEYRAARRPEIERELLTRPAYAPRPEPWQDSARRRMRLGRAVDGRLYAELRPERAAAHRAVQQALRSGRLRRLPCKVCGEPEAHAHHPDYFRTLDVVFLCQTHHAEVHGGALTVSLGDVEPQSEKQRRDLDDYRAAPVLYQLTCWEVSSHPELDRKVAEMAPEEICEMLGMDLDEYDPEQVDDYRDRLLRESEAALFLDTLVREPPDSIECSGGASTRGSPAPGGCSS